MSYNVELEEFVGPLDLLLKLIEDQDLDIANISLAKVADEYLGYIENNPQISPENLADFLVVATKLLLIKSKLLLPVVEADEEETDLEQQLKIYKDFADASVYIDARLKNKNYLYWPDKPAFEIVPKFTPPEELKSEDLKVFFEAILQKLEPLIALPQSVMEKTVTLKDKLFQIRNTLKVRKNFNFKDVIKNSSSKTEVIVVFLALLELLKSEEVLVEQTHHFADISIVKKEYEPEREESLI
jgi:segregation and condensation protein A